jgi:hypothetical protein
MIKSSCETCGDFRATPEAVTSWVDDAGAPLWAVLRCPRCHMVVVRAGNDALTSVLRTLGSPTRVLATPVERLSSEADDADAFTLEDLEAFRDLLDSDDELLGELDR